MIFSSLRKTLHIFFIICTVLLINSCTDNCEDTSQVSDVEVAIEYDALEKGLRNVSNVEELTDLLRDNRAMSDYFLHSQQYPSDEVLARRMYKQIKNPYMDTLFTEVSEKFDDMPSLVSNMAQGFKRLKYHYPNSITPRLQTIVTGFYNDLYITDSLIIVGLDYFVGKDGSYKPNDIPSYILNRYEKENLLPVIFTFLSNDYNKGDLKHNTLLADMINLGKSYYFVSQMLPCVEESLIIGFSTEEMKLVIENQEIIWANIIENEMLYETENFLKSKFVGERPNIPEIHEKCPGRVGAWVGWEIVKSYMDKNSSVSLTQLMENDDAHALFQAARYRPQNINLD